MLSYMLLNCHPGSEPEIISEISELEGVVEVNGVLGKYDVFVKISADNPDAMELIVSKIRKIRMVKHLMASDFCNSWNINIQCVFPDLK